MSKLLPPNVVINSSISAQLGSKGIDVEKEIMTALSAEIATEIDKSILKTLRGNKKPRNCYE